MKMDIVWVPQSAPIFICETLKYMLYVILVPVTQKVYLNNTFCISHISINFCNHGIILNITQAFVLKTLHRK